MDRKDERKDERLEAEVDHERSGDVLGLGGSAVPKAPGDPSASDDPEAVAQRRARVRGSEVTETGSSHGAGATGIDMGAGGTGTDISEK
jgi:hypothetical protein